MAVPTWSAGQVLTADDVNGWLVPFTAAKPADTSRSSTTTQSADPDLVLSLAANAVYWITGYFTFAGAASGSGDLKFSFTAPSGSTVAWSTLGFDGSGNFRLSQPNSSGTGNSQVAESSASNDRTTLVWANIATGGTAGNWTLFWAQNTSSSTATVLRANSLMVAQRIG